MHSDTSNGIVPGPESSSNRCTIRKLEKLEGIV